MFAMGIWQTEIELSMQIFSSMNTHLQTARSKVFAHLQYALFYLRRILGIYYIFLETFLINFLCLLGIGKHKQSLVVLAEYVIYVDTNQYLDFRDIPQFLAQLEIARRTEETNNGQETVKCCHIRSNTLQLIKKRIARSIIKKLGAHSPFVLMSGSRATNDHFVCVFFTLT